MSSFKLLVWCVKLCLKDIKFLYVALQPDRVEVSSTSIKNEPSLYHLNFSTQQCCMYSTDWVGKTHLTIYFYGTPFLPLLHNNTTTAQELCKHQTSSQPWLEPICTFWQSLKICFQVTNIFLVLNVYKLIILVQYFEKYQRKNIAFGSKPAL